MTQPATMPRHRDNDLDERLFISIAKFMSHFNDLRRDSLGEFRSTGYRQMDPITIVVGSKVLARNDRLMDTAALQKLGHELCLTKEGRLFIGREPGDVIRTIEIDNADGVLPEQGRNLVFYQRPDTGPVRAVRRDDLRSDNIRFSTVRFATGISAITIPLRRHFRVLEFPER